MNDSERVPCAVFAWKRPDHLQRVLEALRPQGVAHLIIFVDGPRSDRDLPAVEACRKIARAVDWSEVELHLDEENRGVSYLAVRVGEVLRRYPSAIFVEDDCLPMPGFYPFVCEALRRYRQVQDVFSVSGYQPIRRTFFKRYPWSVVATHRFICWGWGTWRDRWERIATILPRWAHLFDELRNVPDIAGEDLGLAARQVLAGKTESWAVKVALISLSLGMMHLLPVEGLVCNIGVDEGEHRGTPELSRRRKAMHNRNISGATARSWQWLPKPVCDEVYATELRKFVHRAIAPLPLWRARLSAASEKLVKLVPSFVRRTGVVLRTRLGGNIDRSAPVSRAITDIAPAAPPCGKKDSARALLAYVAHPFLVSESDLLYHCHIHFWRVKAMVRGLNELGFTVDLIDYLDTSFRPRRRYEIFIGHGAVNFMSIAQQLSDARKVFFATGAHWKFYNKEISERWRAFCQRHGPAVSAPQLMLSEEPALAAAEAIIGIGNEHTRATYVHFPRVTMLNNTYLSDSQFGPIDKDFERGKLHFLYYASKGGLGKGLDLVLEAFMGLEAHLWVCCEIPREWRALYSKQLASYENIHLVGWIQPRGKRYHELAHLCNFTILPTCSEGQSHAVVECMGHGLLPVVSRACGISVGQWGRIIEPCTIENIREIVSELTRRPTSEYKKHVEEMLTEVERNYSETAFSVGWRQALESVLSAPAASRGT